MIAELEEAGTGLAFMARPIAAPPGVEVGGRRCSESRNEVAHSRNSLAGEEVRQLHQMAVGVEDHVICCISPTISALEHPRR
jgi:hypothetical protein